MVLTMDTAIKREIMVLIKDIVFGIFVNVAFSLGREIKRQEEEEGDED